MTELDREEVSIVANAIGFALYSDDGRDVREIMGVPGIDVTDPEREKCLIAAERALTQLTEHRRLKTRPMEDCWSGPMITELEKAGVVPPHTQRVIIELQLDNFAEMHITAMPTGPQSEKIMDVLTATVQRAEVVEKNA